MKGLFVSIALTVQAFAGALTVTDIDRAILFFIFGESLISGTFFTARLLQQILKNGDWTPCIWHWLENEIVRVGE